MSEVLDLPLFDLRRYVILNSDLEVGKHQKDYHLDIIIRMTEGRYSFYNNREHMDENRQLLKQIVGVDGLTVDMGTIIRVIGGTKSNLIEISGSSEGFLYPSAEETVITSQNRQNTLNIFQRKYPQNNFILVEKHSV